MRQPQRRRRGRFRLCATVRELSRSAGSGESEETFKRDDAGDLGAAAAAADEDEEERERRPRDSARAEDSPVGQTTSSGEFAEVRGSQEPGQGPSSAPAPAPVRGWPSRRLPRSTAFFVMKSFSMRDLKISMQKGIWATQSRNESKLNTAFTDHEAVVLFFSVNESRAFQGYAKMASKTGESEQVWTAVDGTQAWGGVFKVKWQTIYDLSFNDTMHIRNPYNESKPIKISRDGQEVQPQVGLELCAIFDEGYSKDPSNSMKRRKIEEIESTANKRPKNDGVHGMDRHGHGGYGGGGGRGGGGEGCGGGGGGGRCGGGRTGGLGG